MTDQGIRQTLDTASRSWIEKHQIDVALILNMIDDHDLRERIAAVAFQETPDSDELTKKAFKDCITKIQKGWLKEKERKLVDEIGSLNPGNEEILKRKMFELQQLKISEIELNIRH